VVFHSFVACFRVCRRFQAYLACFLYQKSPGSFKKEIAFGALNQGVRGVYYCWVGDQFKYSIYLFIQSLWEREREREILTASWVYTNFPISIKTMEFFLSLRDLTFLSPVSCSEKSSCPQLLTGSSLACHPCRGTMLILCRSKPHLCPAKVRTHFITFPIWKMKRVSPWGFI
jgi:hypothetical protein